MVLAQSLVKRPLLVHRIERCQWYCSLAISWRERNSNTHELLDQLFRHCHDVQWWHLWGSEFP